MMKVQNPMKNEICGTCKHREYDKMGADWQCGNEQSENFTEYPPFDYAECDDWEAK